MKVVARSLTNLQVETTAGRHQFVVDEPIGMGDDEGPNPYDLLLDGLTQIDIRPVFLSG